MSTLTTVRSDLAAVLEADLADDVAVHAYPVEVTTLPAAVIVPTDPYWRPRVFKNGFGMEVGLEVQLIVARTEVSQAFDDLESFAATVGLAIKKVPVFRWQNLGGVEPVEVDGSPALLARVSLKAIV